MDELDRYTKHVDKGIQGRDKSISNTMLKRLVEYEDTGLSPYEISDMHEMFKAYRNVCGGKAPEEIANLNHEIVGKNVEIDKLTSMLKQAIIEGESFKQMNISTVKIAEITILNLMEQLKDAKDALKGGGAE